MANSNYTGSPLGIIHGEKVKYNVNGDSISSAFSSSTTMNRTQSGTLKTRKVGGNFLSQHNDDLYDLSTSHIIEKLKNIPALSLKYADFAYLKNYGVYPNNRLVTIRRFEAPVPDDLFAVDGIKSPMSTIIGYAENIGELVKIDVNEDWEISESTLKNILNDFGNDTMKAVFKDKGGLGDFAGGAAGIIPMGNLTTILQRNILQKMGIIGPNDASDLPIADPNIIRESMQRKMVGEESSGSGLNGKFTIKITTEYEQKFINGVDPTIVYMDIINNALQMGTSKSTFYLGRRDDLAQKARDVINRLSKDPTGELVKWCEAIVGAMSEGLKQLTNFLQGSKESSDEESSEDQKDKNEKDKKNGLIDDAIGSIRGISNLLLENIIKKYRHKLLGFITNITGAPSTPWHVTIGNPLRPIFVSGDMLCKSVEIEPGNILAFNNLPSTIKVTINLQSARNLGLQEIFAKYNAGSIRTINGKYVTTGPTDFFASDNYVYNKPTTKPIPKSTSKESQQSSELDKNNPNITTQNTKATTNGTQKINNDANGEAIIPSTENTGGLSNSSTTESIEPITSGPSAKVIEPEKPVVEKSDDELVEEYEALYNKEKSDPAGFTVSDRKRQLQIEQILNSPGHSF